MARDAELSLVSDPAVCAALVEWADVQALQRINTVENWRSEEALTAAWDREFARAAKECPIPISMSTLMQVWSGCLATAKAISVSNYHTGWISPWFRYNLFKHAIFPECRRSPLYRAGAVAAPVFKRWRREPITTDGIPLRTCGDPAFMGWSFRTP